MPGQWKYTRIAQSQLNVRLRRVNRRRKACQESRSWVLDGDDGAELARSHVWLPSDGHRRKPRLERQEAFHVPEMIFRSDAVQDDAELYQLGILYDDEQLRGAGFTLDSIAHIEPTYEVRPAKRARRGRCPTRYSTIDRDDTISSPPRLVHSSEAEFDLAKFLASSFDEPTQHAPHGGAVAIPLPLHVIYESNEDCAPSLDMLPMEEMIADQSGCESDSDSEVDDGSDCGWDMVPVMRQETSGVHEILAVVDGDADTGTGTETWIVLGET